mmetsp:Transcript_13856/g.32303  ORF Transcript_13856/g.32303 Transcript_13856/m.32303 type:complete len:185 (+) Transcript_13856:73-627(+)
MTTMSIQHSRIANFSFLYSLIGRCGSKAHVRSNNIIPPKSMTMNNMNFETNKLRRSIHSYCTQHHSGVVIDTTPRTKISQWIFTNRDLYNTFFLSLRDMIYSRFTLGVSSPSAQSSGFSRMNLTKMSESSQFLSWAVWLIKRTYQPSLLKKKRQCGYMKRRQSVGGRRILKRRRNKGRKRLFGA